METGWKLDGDVLGLAYAIPSLVVSVLQLYSLMTMNKGLDPLELGWHRKMPHWIDYYPLAPCRGGWTSCYCDIDYSIALAW